MITGDNATAMFSYSLLGILSWVVKESFDATTMYVPALPIVTMTLPVGIGCIVSPSIRYCRTRERKRLQPLPLSSNRTASR